MKGKRFLATLLLCAVSATAVGSTVMTGCDTGSGGGDTNNTQPTGTITLNKNKVSLAMGAQELLRATLGDGLKGTVVWSSSDPTIVTVTGGVIKGVGAGRATVTAAVGEISATCAVTVMEGAVNEVVDETAEVSTKVEGRTYYVAPNGTPSGDGSEANPMDIRTALDFDHHNDDPVYTGPDHFLKPGDTVLVKPGDYKLASRIEIGYSGDYVNPITIKNADPTKKATLKFYDMIFADQSRGVQINGNYFVWDSIDICGAGDNGMYIGGSYNKVLNSEFYDNRDTGLQLGRAYGTQSNVNDWPSYNLIKNCTSYNNYDNETYGENADGFAAKLTVGYGNIFDGCIAYRNSDDGWDLYAKTDTGSIGAVIIYNCVAFENGYIAETQASFNAKFPHFDTAKEETNTNSFKTRDGDGNGLKLGGSIMEGEVFVNNCLTFNNRMHGVTDNSNPGVLVVENVTSYNNAAGVDNEPYIAYGADGKQLSGVNIIKNEDGSLTVTQIVDGEEVPVEGATAVNNPTFGFVSYNENADECANVDLARQFYSYNHVKNVLSVINGNSYCGSDAYRGTVTNSVLVSSGGNNYYRIGVTGEYDTKVGDKGAKLDSPLVASDVFKLLPAADLGVGCGEGYESYYHYLHETMRNADGSINVGDLLMQKDASSTYGCKLNLGTYESYTHWTYTEGGSYANRQEDTAQAIYDMLYLPIQQSGCYQDFQVVARMMHYPVYWESSNPDVISVATRVDMSFSGSYINKVTVNRPIDADTTVTLTATINVGNVAIKNKTFDVVVKKNTYKVGKILVDGLVDNETIVDQYSGYTIVEPAVTNATSESGKLIDSSLYDINYKYELAASSGDGTFKTKRSFSANDCGIWRITAEVVLKSGVNLRTEGDDRGEYQYLIHVAATDVLVDFATEVVDGKEKTTGGFFVNKNGYTIYGQPTNPSGTLYVYKVDDVNAAAPAADVVKANGEKIEFKTTALSLDFEASNSNAYNIYYVFESVDKSKTSPVNVFRVTTQDITTKAELEAMLASNKASVIYRLMNDIDCGGSLANSETKFVGLFNGMGHTIKNIKLANTDKNSKGWGVFRTVENGTIENVTFEDITLTDVAQKTGIIGMMYGGYVYNVKVHNVKISGQQRVGALIGQVISYSGKGSTTFIDKVEVVNDAKYNRVLLSEETFGYYKYYTLADGVYSPAMVYDAQETYYERVIDIVGDRSSGIVGFIQGGDANGWNVVRISNCYANLALQSGDYCGGIVGRSDDRNVRDDLAITNCYFAGYEKVTKRGGGILGGFSGAGKTRIKGCISLGVVYYGNNFDVVLTPQKNSSGIVGNFSATADALVEKCCALVSEYNSNYDVNTVNVYGLSVNSYAEYWEEAMAFDIGGVWEYVKTEQSPNLAAPYVRIKGVGTVPAAA